MCQQMLRQLIQSGDQPLARCRSVGPQQVIGGTLDLVKNVRNLAMVGLELIDHWTERRIGAPQRGKEVDILAGVMEMHEPAVVEAVDLELPQRAPGLELCDLRADTHRLLAVEDLIRQPPHDLQIGTQHAVDPEQLPDEMVAGLLITGQGFVLDHGVASMIPRVERSHSPGATGLSRAGLSYRR